MYNFDFYNPTRIFFGKDRLGEIDKQVPDDAVVLITFGGGSAKKSGLIDKVKTVLGSRMVYEFGGIEPNPRYETLIKAAEVVCEKKVDYILAVGGGSVIDGTKFITLASHFKGDPRDLLYYGFASVPFDILNNVVPFGTVLTLPATGSEMNSGAVISYEHGKFPVMCELTFPRFSILDPVVTFTLPEIQIANGIIDTFIHTTEQYITYPVDARIQDRIAEGLLQTLIEIVKTTIAEPGKL